ncbi:arylformamidase [Halolactibacillus halophilus]|uniref:Kynurenine formamidase n=1 Tax=Halolactibacillus halophilus TaxID=306540 RepID=A0A1I5LYA3_9BACI|nr:cyclase family protein [Halolactibacillus halophilus]GEM00942.1 kynurenine formamidase [Halolactibacillus halophilus]SFP02328.1 arylformamidase [Halolactibacillus halophilus]
MTYIDITMPLINKGATWPGDTPYRFKLSATMKDTGSVNIGEITSSLHNGTHMDAPFHYDNHGRTIDQLDVSIGIGTCQIVDVRGLDKVTVSNLEKLNLSGVSRLLFHMLDRDPAVFPEQFPLLTVEAVDYLATIGIKLIGTDAPSVDAVNSKTLPIHLAIHKARITIIENLYLNDVSAGHYHLYAVPLKIVGGDASPVRALVIPIVD